MYTVDDVEPQYRTLYESLCCLTVASAAYVCVCVEVVTATT